MTTKNNVDRAATFISDAIEDIESGRDLGALSFLREAMFLLLEALSEMTPIPAVASAERERLIADLANVWMNTQAAPGQVIRNAAKMLRADADLLQRAQADALDARRLREALSKMTQLVGNNDGEAEAVLLAAWHIGVDALRTSSPDPVVPRGEDVNYCCHACWKEIRNSPILDRMILCDVCGNKRCPKANDHRNACTNSNEPGQEGSAYA